MIKKTFFPILCLSLLLIACGGADENTLEFETVTADKSVNLSNEVLSPTCKVHLELEAVTENMGHRAEVINNTVMKRLLDEEEETMQLAANAFAEKYTESYQKTMLPLYNEDRADTTKRSWYEYHYVVKCSTQRGSKGTYVYLATVDYYEGGAHGINQLITLNFEAKTGRQLMLDGFGHGRRYGEGFLHRNGSLSLCYRNRIRMFRCLRRVYEQDAGYGCRNGGDSGKTSPPAHRNYATFPVQPGGNALPYFGRDLFRRVEQQIPYAYVEFVLFHLSPFIISCKRSRARCNLEREVASVHPSSSAISLWE